MINSDKMKKLEAQNEILMSKVKDLQDLKK